ncbi:MAG: NAD(P)-dependent oxidoreductase [Acidobacteria bacterium]|nr:NAD(P)-dependent oxidoreductase [Acidobacteriota bacterium]
MKTLVTGGSGFIGTTLVDVLLRQGEEICNLDIAEPNEKSHRTFWRQCNILDRDSLQKEFGEFQPVHVIHLAARTDTWPHLRVEDYKVNTEGTANLLEMIQESESVLRFVHTSTQYVLKPGRVPQHDEDYDPHTAYGESKVIAERLLRAANLRCLWTIIRPTNIWGPWHPRYPHEFWHVLSRGLYFHPSGKPVFRCYGYVGNVVFQIQQILRAPAEVVDRKVFYVGDRPISLLDWVSGFARALTGKDARVVPRTFLRLLAWFGDACLLLGIKFPIYSSRLQSMTEEYLTHMEPTMSAFGEPPYSLEAGIQETARWLQREGYVRRVYI